jgi:hypothetical protein
MGIYIDTEMHRWEYKLNTWVSKIFEWLVVAMISMGTSSVRKEDVFPKLLYCDSRYSQTCRRCSQVCHQRSLVLPGLSSALPGLSPALQVPLKVGSNALPRSATLLKLTHLSLHSISSQTLLKTCSDKNTFCWCRYGSGRMFPSVWANLKLGGRKLGVKRPVKQLKNI